MTTYLVVFAITAIALVPAHLDAIEDGLIVYGWLLGAALLAGVGVALTGSWRRSGKLLVCACAVFAGVLLGALTGMALLYAQEDLTEMRGDLIADALERYHRDTGEYPQRLGQLTPKYLLEVPASAMGLFRRFGFRYTARGTSYELAFDTWAFDDCVRGPGGEWACGD